ncbi:MAG: hypothetical protein MI802_17820 [Desulfobacterales bacterium]|nr:hypothetical protein [Desulfobacterales bacterium]
MTGKLRKEQGGLRFISIVYSVIGVLMMIGMYILALSVMLGGCGGKPVLTGDSPWQATAVVADGSDVEWQSFPPQYVDRTNRIIMRVANDDQAIYIAVAVGSREMIRRLGQAGLKLTLDPIPDVPENIGEEKEGVEDIPPFSIALKRLTPYGGYGNEKGREAAGEVAAPPMEIMLPETLTISYPYGSDPLIMNLSEAGEKDIHIGVQGGERFVFEAAIRFDAISSFGDFGPGARMAVTFSPGNLRMSATGEGGGRRGRQSGGGGRKGGGGRPAVSDGRPTGESVEARVEVRLSSSPA